VIERAADHQNNNWRPDHVVDWVGCSSMGCCFFFFLVVADNLEVCYFYCGGVALSVNNA